MVVGGWVVGWGEIEIKAKLSPAKAGAWAELGKNSMIDTASYCLTLFSTSLKINIIFSAF